MRGCAGQLHRLSGHIHCGKYGSGHFVLHTTGRHVPLNSRPNYHKMATLNISVLMALNLLDSLAFS